MVCANVVERGRAALGVRLATVVVLVPSPIARGVRCVDHGEISKDCFQSGTNANDCSSLTTAIRIHNLWEHM